MADKHDEGGVDVSHVKAGLSRVLALCDEAEYLRAEVNRLGGVIEAMADEAKPLRWTSVNDALPPLLISVITTDGRQVLPCYRTNDLGSPARWSSWRTDEVTHWMPMPPPPAMAEKRRRESGA